MIIATKEYTKHSYLIGVLNLFKLAFLKLFGLLRSNGHFFKIRQAYLAKAVMSYYPVLEVLDKDSLKCVSCGLCENICPTKCINVMQNNDIQISSPKMHFGLPPKEFNIDLRKCIQCGLCQEVCPVEAISMTGEYDLLNHSKKIWSLAELSKQSKPPKQEF